MARKASRDNSNSAGFTIVELLIVIVVIAILAAITIVAYNGIQSQAKWSRAMTETKSLATQLELYQQKNGAYPADNTALTTVIKSSGLWDATRTTEHTYLLCSTASEFHVVPFPFKDPQPSPVPAGAEIHLYTTNAGWRTIAFDPNADPTTTLKNDICASLIASQPRFARWAHELTD